MNRIAFSLALAAAAITFGAAQAAPIDAGRSRAVVSAAGLDLHTAAGAAAFHARIKAAAFQACLQSRGIDDTLSGQGQLDDCVRETVKAALAGQSAS